MILSPNGASTPQPLLTSITDTVWEYTPLLLKSEDLVQSADIHILNDSLRDWAAWRGAVFTRALHDTSVVAVSAVVSSYTHTHTLYVLFLVDFSCSWVWVVVVPLYWMLWRPIPSVTWTISLSSLSQLAMLTSKSISPSVFLDWRYTKVQ